MTLDFQWDRVSRSPFCIGTVLLGAVLLCGCQPSTAQRQFEEQKKVDQQIGKLYDGYLQADADSARKILQNSIRLLEDDKKITEYYRVSNLGLTYSRLYTLEQRLSNTLAADADFLKVRYFVLRRNEIEGHSLQEATDGVNASTPAKIVEVVSETDKKATGGKGPQYLRQR